MYNRGQYELSPTLLRRPVFERAAYVLRNELRSLGLGTIWHIEKHRSLWIPQTRKRPDRVFELKLPARVHPSPTLCAFPRLLSKLVKASPAYYMAILATVHGDDVEEVSDN